MSPLMATEVLKTYSNMIKETKVLFSNLRLSPGEMFREQKPEIIRFMERGFFWLWHRHYKHFIGFINLIDMHP